MATPSAVVYVEYTTTRVSSGHTSHTFCYFCFCVLKTVPFLLFMVWVIGLSFLCFARFTLLAVFANAVAFNQDVSKWNTGAVTEMTYSKCTLSLSHSVATPSIVVNSSFVGLHVHVQFSHSHVLFLFLLLFQSVLRQWLHTNTLRWRMGILNKLEECI